MNLNIPDVTIIDVKEEEKTYHIFVYFKQHPEKKREALYIYSISISRYAQKKILYLE